MMRKEEAVSLRKTIFFGGLTILFVLGLIFFGIPSLVKMAVILSEIKNSSTPFEQSDTIPPAPPQLNSLPEATNTNSISVSGFAEPSTTVEIFLNDASFKKVVTAQDGTYLADNLNLKESQNEIYAIAQDLAGNKSQPSEKITILFDKTPPELSINSPENGTSFTGEKERKTKISGKTEPGANLTINDHFEILDKDGNFSTIYTLSEGENILKFVATDLAGNKTEKEMKLTFAP